MSKACPADPARQKFVRSHSIDLLQGFEEHLQSRPSKAAKPNYALLDKESLDLLLSILDRVYPILELEQHVRLDQSSIHREAV